MLDKTEILTLSTVAFHFDICPQLTGSPSMSRHVSVYDIHSQRFWSFRKCSQLVQSPCKMSNWSLLQCLFCWDPISAVKLSAHIHCKWEAIMTRFDGQWNVLGESVRATCQAALAQSRDCCAVILSLHDTPQNTLKLFSYRWWSGKISPFSPLWTC